MVVAGENSGSPDLGHVEVVDLSAPIAIPCFIPAQLPEATHALVGTFIDGAPLVCGGRHTSNCYR